VESRKKHADFIAYAKLDAWRNFGGIRIEDDVLVTKIAGASWASGFPRLPPNLRRR
jgi:hypothetical protein